MHALVVTSHPSPASLTHAVANRVVAGLHKAGHSAEVAHLAQEGFDPRFTAADTAVHEHRAPPSPDVAAEQVRIDRADALLLVFPVYWWSLPAQLKGWIDRVFCNGWAYDEGPGTGTVKRLQRLSVHLVGLGGADPGTYARRGYAEAMKTQIERGIFDYCGACVASSQLLLGVAAQDAQAHLLAAETIGARLFDAIPPCTDARAA